MYTHRQLMESELAYAHLHAKTAYHGQVERAQSGVVAAGYFLLSALVTVMIVGTTVLMAMR